MGFTVYIFCSIYIKNINIISNKINAFNVITFLINLLNYDDDC